MNIRKNNRGVTIVEVLITLVCGLILVVVFAAMVSNKKSQIQNVYRNEARVVIKDIVNKQRMYYARTGSYINEISKTNVSPELDIDLRKNEYFKEFEANVDNSGFFSPVNPKIAVTVFGAGGAAGMTVSGEYDARTIDDKKYDADGIKYNYK